MTTLAAITSISRVAFFHFGGRPAWIILAILAAGALLLAMAGITGLVLWLSLKKK